MNKKVVSLIFVFCLTIGASSASNAQVFVGAGVSSNSYDYSDLDNSTGNKIYAGYYAQGGVFGEVALIDLGDTQAEGSSLGLEVDGLAAYIGYQGGEPVGFGAFGKIGFYSVDSNLLISGISVQSKSSSGLAWGLGFYYAFNKVFALRGELEQYVAVEDFADDNSITGFSLSLEVRF